MLAIRRLFPYVVLLLLCGSLAWAVSFGTLPPADFTFNNEDEIATIDPAKATGQPENRIINAVFEGLIRMLPTPDGQPDENGLVPLVPTSGCSERPSLSDDRLTYTFRIRPDARWSNGDPVTSHDFAWSWRRTLHPETAAIYAYQLYYIQGAKEYNKAEPLDPAEDTPTDGKSDPSASATPDARFRVEIELKDRADDLQLFPRGTILRGTLKELRRPPAPQLAEHASEDDKEKANTAWRKKWIFVVDVDAPESKAPDSKAPNTKAAASKAGAAGRRMFATSPDAAEFAKGETLEQVRHVLPEFETTVGISTPDDRTLVVHLANPTPFFEELVAFYPYFPVHPATVEKYGTPYWTKPGRIVSNGPFLLETRRIRDRIRLVKNDKYWEADAVQLRVVDALPIKFQSTALSMFLKGQLDWITKPPTTIIKDLENRPDLVRGPALITYFYRLNVDRKPLDDVRVRRALNLAMDKQSICDRVSRAGELPARCLVPPGLLGYEQALCGQYDPDEARRLLAEAGFPEGRGFPRLQILFNTHEAHRDIAEVIQQQWKQNLGIDMELRNLEWKVYLDTTNKIDYDIARAGWVPDYSDPNTYLDMWVTGGGHNNTNWSNTDYDRLIDEAGAELDLKRRLELMHDAERLLMDELPIIPIYHYVTLNMVNLRVKNFTANGQDQHPLHILRVDDLRSQPPAARN